MALRKIHKDGDPALKKKAKPVTKFDNRLAILIDDMIETLKDANGVGLAAPQVGIIKKVIVIDTDEEAGFVELVNPVIYERKGEQVYYEGCLSYPGYYGNVGRPKTVKVRAFNRKGEAIAFEAGGLYAVACSHEADHLEGEMFMPKVKGPLYTLEEVKAMREKAEAKTSGATAGDTGAGGETQPQAGGVYDPETKDGAESKASEGYMRRINPL